MAQHTFEERPVACILRFGGDLDGREEAELRKIFVRARQDQQTNLAADMRKVQFLDSTALGTLVWAMKNQREAGGDLRLFGLAPPVRRIFETTALDRAFQIFDSESQALSSFAPAP